VINLSDKIILQIDAALKTLWPSQPRLTPRATPGTDSQPTKLNHQQKKHIAGLMRVNHTGEVCAQALYQGQALTAKLEDIREKMLQSADEEIDHLAWCESRLTDLDAHTSYMNSLWYVLSFTIGATAGLIGDKWSLGFVVETERQVTHHLESHLKQIPSSDEKTIQILQQMIIDESNHAASALAAGGAELPIFIKTLMQFMSKFMTKTSYYF
jgi:ubiquinone biosynthesis monooxygenase Coq7